MCRMGRAVSCLVVLVAAAGWAPNARAQGPELAEAETARLGLLSTDDRRALAPHLARGPVALVEFSEETELPAIIFATRVNAPAERVARVIADPTQYPRFMPALDSVNVESRREQMTAYDWTWRTAVFTLRGDAVMTMYPAPRGRRDRPWRIEIRNTGGDLGVGRQVWRVYPEGPSRSLVVFSSRIDMRDANYVTRQIGRQRSINRTVNLSLAYVMMMGIRGETERVVGTTRVAPQGDPPPLRKPIVDIFELRSLLFRGDLVLMDMTGDRLDQVAVVGRLAAPLPPTRAVMEDPRAFGPALIPGSYANVVREEGNEIDFAWGVDIPLVGTSGKMRMTNRDRISVEAIEGALTGGQWHFETPVYDWGEACVLAWGRFDPRDSNWLIRMLVDGAPELGHGIQAGTELMVVRAIRSRTLDRVEEERERARAERRAAAEARAQEAQRARTARAAEPAEDEVAERERARQWALARVQAARARARVVARRRQVYTDTPGGGHVVQQVPAEPEPIPASVLRRLPIDPITR